MTCFSLILSHSSFQNPILQVCSKLSGPKYYFYPWLFFWHYYVWLSCNSRIKSPKNNTNIIISIEFFLSTLQPTIDFWSSWPILHQPKVHSGISWANTFCKQKMENGKNLMWTNAKYLTHAILSSRNADYASKFWLQFWITCLWDFFILSVRIFCSNPINKNACTTVKRTPKWKTNQIFLNVRQGVDI